jgi:origin recognition complex subunit 6
MPSIRTVCKILCTRAPRTNSWSRPPISRTLPPHIFVGVSSILHFVSELKKNSQAKTIEPDLMEFLEPLLLAADKQISQDDEDYREMVLALIVAVYFLVLARRRTPSTRASTNPAAISGGSPSRSASTESGADCDDNRQMDKKTFTEMRSTALSSLGLLPTEKRYGEDVDTWIALIMELGWAKGKEWFENIPMAGEEDQFSRHPFDEDDYGIGDYHDEDDSESSNIIGPNKRRKGNPITGVDDRGGLLPGLGTMMQDRVDWLSEYRREDFREWKDDIIKRIQKMERKR